MPPPHTLVHHLWCWHTFFRSLFLLARQMLHMLSSPTSSLQASATRAAAHASNSAIRFVIPPCALKAERGFAHSSSPKYTVTCLCGMRFRLSTQQVVCRSLSVCTASSRFPFLFQAQSHTFQARFSIVVSQLFSQSSRRNLGANFIFFPACFFPGDELLVFLEGAA